MEGNPWARLADLEESFGNNPDRSGPGYSEAEVDAEWEIVELKFRDDL